MIECSDARVEVTALVATDVADASSRMRALKLSLADHSGFDQVYLDESLLPALQEDLAGIESGIPELEQGSAPYRVQGTASGWRPYHPQRILCPSYRVGPAELAALIERAIEALPAP